MPVNSYGELQKQYRMGPEEETPEEDAGEGQEETQQPTAGQQTEQRNQDQEVGDAEPETPEAPETPQQPERLTTQPKRAQPMMPRVFAGEKELHFDPNTGEEIVPAMEQYNRQMAILFANIPPALKGKFVMDQVKLTQLEHINLQKMQNAMAAVDANPDLTPEEKAHLKTRIQTGINPLAIRNAKAQAMGTELKNQQMKQQLDIVTQNMQDQEQAFATGAEKTFASHAGLPGEEGHQSYTQRDPKSGLRHAVPGLPGSKEYVAQKAHEETTALKKRELDLRERELGRKDRADEYARKEKAWNTAFDRADTSAEKRMKARDAAEQDKAIKMNKQEAGSGDEYLKLYQANRESAHELEREKILRAKGLPVSQEDFEDKHAPLATPVAAGDASEAAPLPQTSGTSGQPVQGAKGAPPANQNPDKTKQIDDQFTEAYKKLESSEHMAGTKSYLKAQLDTLRGLIKQYGPVEGMQGEVRNRALTAMTILQNAGQKQTKPSGRKVSDDSYSGGYGR